MICEQFEICGYIYEFLCNNKKIHEYLLGLLENHRCTDVKNVDFSFVLQTDSYIDVKNITNGNCIWETKKVRVTTEDMRAFYAWIDINKIREMESLYYHLFSPVIKKTLCYKGLFYLHGACLEINNKGIIFLGERNAGKSTLSILELLEGNRFLTDDCIFLDDFMKAKSIYRPIHIDPNMGEMLKISDRISVDDKYLSKEKEVNYYPQKFHKEQLIQQLKVDAIVFLHLSKDKESNLVSMKPEQVAKEIYLYSEDFHHEKLVEILKSVSVYSMTWGEKELNNPECLHELLANVA